MSFKENAYQQMSLTDSFSGLTAREQKALEKSWAKVFSDEIFPAIDEKRFSVLYSDKASRPNTPVNVIDGALIIKELFDYSNDEMVENLMLDFRIQYALHTTQRTRLIHTHPLQTALPLLSPPRSSIAVSGSSPPSPSR